MFKIMKEKCDQCLFSKNKIVSNQRKKQLINECKEKQTHFNCHKTDNVVCAGFNESMGEYSQSIRMAGRLGVIEYVEVENVNS